MTGVQTCALPISYFEHVNLHDVVPGMKKIPDGTVLKCKIISAKKVQYPDKVTGEEKERIAIKSIVDGSSGEFAGREINTTIWQDKSDAKRKISYEQLRKIMDATGIKQDGATMTEWLESLVNEQAMLEAPVRNKPGSDGQPWPELVFLAARPA